nr:unnamed protein product [Callosobruchus analis]
MVEVFSEQCCVSCDKGWAEDADFAAHIALTLRVLTQLVIPHRVLRIQDTPVHDLNGVLLQKGTVTASDGARAKGRQLRTSPLAGNTLQGSSRCLISNKGTDGASTNSNQSSIHDTYETRIRELESVVERMARQNPRVETRRLVVRNDCIPELCPQNENMSAVKWLEKNEELKQISDWDDLTRIYHIQSRFSSMARSWYHSLNSCHYPKCGSSRSLRKSLFGGYLSMLREERITQDLTPQKEVPIKSRLKMDFHHSFSNTRNKPCQTRCFKCEVL